VHCLVPAGAGAQQALAGGSALRLSYRFPDPNVVLSRASRQPQVRPCGSSRPMSVPRLWVHPSVECPESFGMIPTSSCGTTSSVVAIVKASTMILQLPYRQSQGRLSATSGALVDGTIVALSFAAAPPRAQAGIAIAVRTTLSTCSLTRPPKERCRSPLMRLRCRSSPSSRPMSVRVPTYNCNDTCIALSGRVQGHL
jgi:hypothetical protein